jgi:peptide/nickel transport system substrate-binding protein
VPLFRQAVEILFKDMPTIPMVQAPALVPFSTTYWTGWPSAENPWNMPVSWWATFNLVIMGYPDPETGEWVGGIQPTGG